MDNVYIGTELKYAIKIESPGFDMDSDDFEIRLQRGTNVQTLTKDDLIREVGEDESVTWYMCFDSAFFGKGPITVIVTAYVPDTDFDDGIRTEVDKFEIVNVNKI